MGPNVLVKRKNELLVLLSSSLIMLILLFVIPAIERLNSDAIVVGLGKESKLKGGEAFADSLITLDVLSDVWYPYCGEGGTTKEGYVIDILRMIFEPEGYRINYQNRPWARCIEEVKTGSAHALAGCTIEEVNGFVIPSENIGFWSNVFFTLKKSRFSYRDVSSLIGVKLGVVQNYGYTEELNSFIDTVSNKENIIYSRGENPLGSLILGLLAERVTVVVEDRLTFNYTAKLMGIDTETFREAGSHNEFSDLLVAFSPSKPESEKLKQIFDRRIQELRQSGKLKMILDKYQIFDWKLR